MRNAVLNAKFLPFSFLFVFKCFEIHSKAAFILTLAQNSTETALQIQNFWLLGVTKYFLHKSKENSATAGMHASACKRNKNGGSEWVKTTLQIAKPS